MTGQYRIEAPRQAVWEALNDVEVLRQCIPGVEEIEKTSDTSFTAKVRAKVGRSEEHTSELQSLMRISYAVFCLKNKTQYPLNNGLSFMHRHNISRRRPVNYCLDVHHVDIT